MRKEHTYSEEEYLYDQSALEQLRNRAQMSKYAWRSLKKKRPITVRHGFTLMSY